MHQRPVISNFLAIKTPLTLTVRLSLFLESIHYKKKRKAIKTPIDSMAKLQKSSFSLLLECFDNHNKKILSKIYESNSFGNFFIRITDQSALENISRMKLYETQQTRGVEYYLGSFRPLCLTEAPDIVISDFDKTLADTRYSTTREIYQSLTSPLDFFPTVTKSVTKLKNFTNLGHNPFILTASPHFYEDAIRDWLYAHSLFTAGIFLKDFRQVLSLIPAELAPKDLKIQGMYKLNHLLTIILMTGIPKNLVLMGDNFESDPAIYATMALILGNQLEAWQVWKRVKTLPEFQFSNQQNGQILGKLYQIESMKKKNLGPTSVRILIRKLGRHDSCKLDKEIFATVSHLIELY